MANATQFDPVCTLDECAAMLGVTRERVRQIEAKALNKIRVKLRALGLTLSDFLDTGTDNKLTYNKEIATKPASTPQKQPKHLRKPRGNIGAAITVDGILHSSVRRAFIALNLPISKHERFRADLKKAGKLPFTHEGRTYQFECAKAEPADAD